MFCYICKNEAEHGDSHHLIPQARGGKKGPTILLCPTCHSESHSMAINKSISVASIQNYELRKVVLLLRLASQLEHDECYKMNISVPKHIYLRLRQEAKTTKVSMAKIVISSISAFLKKGDK